MKIELVDYFNKKFKKRISKKLYFSAFPENERVPYSILISRMKKNKGEYYNIYEEEKYIGLIYNIVYKDIVYIYYFAIVEELRHCGYGSKILSLIKEKYKDKKICLMAETLDDKASNYLERVNRNKFYSKNGFMYLGYTIREIDVVYDMLGTNKKVEKEEFKNLIHNYFGEFSYNKVYKKISDIED